MSVSNFFFFFGLKSSFLTHGMNKWANKVPSVSLKLFGLFPVIHVVGTHLRGCGRSSCYFHDSITHKSLITLYSKSHFHLSGTSWAEPELKATSRGHCSMSLFRLCCFIFRAMWLSWCSLNPLRLTELLERHKAERQCLLSPDLTSYSQLFTGSTNHFALSPRFPKRPFFALMFRAQECSVFHTDVALCMINTMGDCTAGIPADPLLSEDFLLSAPPLCSEISNESLPFCVSVNFSFSTSDFDCRVSG